MKRTSKKGFTLVELVIVIAVIAILAAVLIPTFSSIIRKANQSADIQAVREMNTVLAVNEVLEGKTILDVYDALKTGGMDSKDYKPLTSDTYFFWDSTLNRILYTDGNYSVIFPEEYSDITPSTAGHQWYSLSSTLKATEYNYSNKVSGSGTTASPYVLPVSSVGEFTTIINDINNEKISTYLSKQPGVNYYYGLGQPGATGDGITTFTGNIKIVLSNDIDFMGASFSLTGLDNGVFELDGQNHTIKGLVNSTSFALSNQNGQNIEKAYGAGIVGYVSKTATVKIHDVTFENCESGAYTVTINDEEKLYNNNGLLIGCCYGNAEITNVTFTNCHVYANKRAGIVYGQASQASTGNQIVLNGLTFNNCSVNAKNSIASVIGNKLGVNSNTSYVKIVNNGTITITGCTVNAPAKKGLYATFNEGAVICDDLASFTAALDD